MKFSQTTQLSETNADMLVYILEESDTTELTPELSQLNITVHNAISSTIQIQNWKATSQSTLLIQTHGLSNFAHILLIGTGKKEEVTVESVLQTGSVITKKAAQCNAKTIAINPSYTDLPVPDVASLLTTGMLLSSYTYDKYKKRNDDTHQVESVVFISADDLSSSISKGEIESQAVFFTRDLVNEPPSTMTPSHLAQVAQEISKNQKNVSCKILSVKDMEKLGMGGILGIGKGSAQEPKFIHLSYNGGGDKTVVLIGKGITFDSGGLSIKPGKGMEIMKCDMAGAALVLGVFSVLTKLNPKHTVHGLISSAENLLGPHAVKPGDILTAMNGKTMEILNTDAEGRVVLADALSYAGATLKPDVILDFATLTGACIIALGDDIAGVFVNNSDLKEQLFTSAQKTGESIWELPIPKQYKNMMKSKVADVQNIGPSRSAGAIQGALFLQEFVPDGVPWAHFDIAGPSFAEKDLPLAPYGGTGFGVRMIIDYLVSMKV